MPGLRQFKIFFDNPCATYFGGQTVTGKLRLDLDNSVRTRGIEVRFRGETRVRWNVEKKVKDEDGHSIMRPEEYSSHELYFDSPIFVVGGPTSEILLQPGEHTYNFTMQLPTILPSSFEGKFGYIRYTVCASLIYSIQGSQTVKEAFTVLCPLDLNCEPNVKNPLMVTEEKYLCCCCCKSGPITCVLSLPATGFAPGQEIPFSVEVDNISDRTISVVILSLRKTITFKVVRPEQKTAVDSSKVVQMVLGGVAAHDSCSWTERLELPCLPPSYLKHCSVINVEYHIEVEVKITGPHKNFSAEAPIVIGTIPIMSAAPSSSGGEQLAYTPASPNPTAPPMYEDCFFGPGNIREQEDNSNMYGNVNFVPRYPTYRKQAHA